VLAPKANPPNRHWVARAFPQVTQARAADVQVNQGALGGHGKSSHRSDHADPIPKKQHKNPENFIELAFGVGVVGLQKHAEPTWVGGVRPINRWNKHGMALAHHPDPEEVDCLLRNVELRDAIEPTCGARRCHRRLLRLMHRTALPRHLPDCVGETHGAGGGGVSFCVPGVWWRHRAQSRPPAGAGSLRTGGSQAGEGQDGFARVKSTPGTSRRTARTTARLAGPWPADRLGRARAGQLSTGQSFRHFPTSCPTSTSTASDGIPCHGADGPREERFQDGLEPTRKIRP
jgi:hypothetical protein